MNAEKWERMKEIFASALELQRREREAFLRDACAGDDPLIAELQALLAAHESNQEDSNQDESNKYYSHQIESEESYGSTASVASKWDGQNIGPYRVIQRIGSGGMGDVYLAARADDAFNKRVAIKLVQTGINTQEILQRFRHERQILAALDHPNIARLLDGGTTGNGLPFFVMDYVEGTPLNTYCDTHKLTILERIRLFRNICSAVHYVHQNLVVHRDLKPNNILVTLDGVPKLLDFGIAKLLKPEFSSDPMDATRIEFRLMTPKYASPEQVRGEAVTTASDVYSLGVILYELLTAHRPYRLKTDSAEEIFRAICDQEPEKPSTRTFQIDDGENRRFEEEIQSTAKIAQLRATVPEKLKRELSGDLDMIVMKALRKEPQHRYPSAEQLSEDLRRHLEGLPVTAHRDSTRYRAGKFIRRHKAGVAAAALVFVSLVAGVLATARQARVAREEKAEAERQFNDVRKLTTSFLFEFDNAIQNLPGSIAARQLIVHRALEYLNKLDAHAPGDASLQRELAEAYLKVGDVQGNPYGPNLGDGTGAVQSYRKALEISQALTQLDPKDVIATEYLGRSYASLGAVLPTFGKPTEGAADLAKAAEILESLAHSTRHDHDDDKELRFRLANTYQLLGDIQGHIGTPNLGDAASSLNSYRKALALYEDLLATDGNDARARRAAASLQIRIGDSQAPDDPQGAMRNYQSALSTFEQLVAADPNSSEDRRHLSHAYQKVGGIEESLGKNKEALQHYMKASEMHEAMMRADPNNAQAGMALVISLRYTADLLYNMNDRSRAITYYRRALNILQRLSLEPGNVLARGRYSEMLVVLSMALAETGQTAEARDMTSRGLNIARQLADRDDVTADELFDYAESFLTCEPTDLRQPATALVYAKRAVEKSGNVSDYLDQLARAYFQSGDSVKAVESEERALSSLSPDSHSRRTLEAHLSKFKLATKPN